VGSHRAEAGQPNARLRHGPDALQEDRLLLQPLEAAAVPQEHLGTPHFGAARLNPA